MYSLSLQSFVHSPHSVLLLYVGNFFVNWSAVQSVIQKTDEDLDEENGNV